VAIAHVNGTQLNYVQVESQLGPACEDLVMVHGLATNMAFWYFHYAPVFAQRYRVTLYDLRGHGRSAMPERGYTPQNLATDLQQLLDHLDIPRAHFVTHSFGGVVALNLACLDPGRIGTLVLADTHISAARHAHSSTDWGQGNEIQTILKQNGLSLDTSDPYFGYKLLTEVAHLQLNNTEVPAALLELVGPLIGKYGQRTATQWLKLMHGLHAERELMGDDGLSLEKLQKLNFPILSMYGDRSQAKITGKQLLDIWPHAEFRRVRDAGHFFPSSKPAEVIAGCQQFWDGEFSKKITHRHGESIKSHFRSERMYHAQGAWYCSTREAEKIGPFVGRGEAEQYLRAFLTEKAARHASEVSG